MSDIADELRAFEGSEALANGDFNVCVRGATEITSLRAAINDALTAPWPDPELNSTWHQEPIGPNETPEEAVARLVRVRAEWAVYKNNCENPVIAELRAALATARREGMEEAARIAADFETVAYQHGNLPADDPHECAAQAAREIAASIRAAAKEEKP